MSSEINWLKHGIDNGNWYFYRKEDAHTLWSYVAKRGGFGCKGKHMYVAHSLIHMREGCINNELDFLENYIRAWF